VSHFLAPVAIGEHDCAEFARGVGACGLRRCVVMPAVASNRTTFAPARLVCQHTSGNSKYLPHSTMLVAQILAVAAETCRVAKSSLSRT
jgi:hypothetical protein